MQAKIEDVICFTVPLLVPTANHYRDPVRFIGRNGYLRLGFKLTKEAKAYQEAVAIFAHGRTVSPATAAERRKARYTVQMDVYLGPRQRLDSDNALKVGIDSLVRCGVLHSDANVYESRAIIHKDERNNPENPRTQYLVTRMEQDGKTK
jgi:Holliday junction resolvase RusA-like endonuclease